MPLFRSRKLRDVPWMIPLSFAAATLIFAWLAGQEMSWDVVNHHYYIPFAWLHERVTSDYFGAGPQSYQNPAGYLLFYGLIQAGLPQWAIGLVLATLHAGCAVCAWHIGRLLWRDRPDITRWVALATAAAWLTPAYLQTVGTSSNDPLGALLVMAALALLVSPHLYACRLAAAWVGLLLGAALGMKLSNAPWIAACGVVALVQVAQKRQPTGMLAIWTATGAAGTAAVGGWPAFVLWREFGNPIFPFYNNLFQSPLGPDGAFTAVRFIPASIPALLARPFEMALPKAYIYSENFAPDLRPAIFVTVGVLLLLAVAIRTLRKPVVAAAVNARRWQPTDTDLAVFLLVGAALWLATSGNGRYGIPLLMLVGVMAMRWLWMTLPERPARTIAMALLCIQATVFWFSADWHRNAEPWTGAPFYDVQASRRLSTTPILHLTLGIQTHASIAAIALDPAGALVNPAGQYSIPIDGVRGAPLHRLMDKWRGRTRVLIKEMSPGHPVASRTFYDEWVYRLGISVDWNDCEPVRLLRTNGYLGLWSCAIVSPARIPAPWAKEQATADRAFTVLEQKCPDLYGPTPVITERIEGAWRRFYANSDTHVLVSPLIGVFTMNGRNMRPRRAGSLEQVVTGRGTIDCTPWTWTTPEL